MKLAVSEKCRICAREETTAHILLSCPERFAMYTRRHDKVLYQLIKSVCTALKMKMPQSLMKQGGVSRSGVLRNATVTIMVDQVLRTSRWIRERKPDLVVRLKEENRAIIFEVACAVDNLVYM